MTYLQLFPVRIFLIVSLSGMLLLAGCDNPASGGEEVHADPKGLELVHENDVIYKYFEGNLTEPTHKHFLVGKEYPFEVHFLDAEGNHIHDEDLGEDYSLDWNIENENILEIYQQEEDERWYFHLEGIAEGGSKVQFLLMHGGNHADFKTIPVESENAIEFHIDADDEGEYDH